MFFSFFLPQSNIQEVHIPEMTRNGTGRILTVKMGNDCPQSYILIIFLFFFSIHYTKENLPLGLLSKM